MGVPLQVALPGPAAAGPLDVVVRVLAFGSFSALAWWFGARPVA